MSDMRKWINLMEEDSDEYYESRGTFRRFRDSENWYESYDLSEKFFIEAYWEEWEELIQNDDGYNEMGLLHRAKIFFNRAVSEEYANYRLTKLETVEEFDMQFMWKVINIKSLD